MANILALDDNLELCKLIRTALERDGHRVETRSSGQELTEALCRWADCILLDVMMPGEDGFAVCRCIRGLTEAPILFLSARTDEAAVLKGLGAQNIGAGKHDRVDAILRYAIGIGLTFGLIVAAAVQFIAPSVVRPFTSDEAVVLAGASYIRGYIFDCLFAGVQFSFSGYFCAYGKSGLSFLYNTLSILLVRVPGAYLASKFFPQTLLPMGLASACGSLFSILVCVIAYHWLKRQQKAVLYG